MGDLGKRFGARLKAIRTRRGLTQAQLGDRAAMSEEWVRRMERGEASPSFDTIEALCATLEVYPSELFETGQTSSELDAIVDAARRLPPPELTWVRQLIDHLSKRPRPGE